jgi:hypothetical protein
MNNLNEQLQSLQARIERIDEDLIANYAGISQLTLALAANKYTAVSAAPSALIYNLSPGGQTLIKNLLGLIPGIDLFKKLQLLQSGALLGTLGDAFSSSISDFATSLQDTITEQLSIKSLAETALNTATANLQTAIENEASQETIEALQIVKDAAELDVNIADEALLALDDGVSQLNGVTSQLSSFLSSQSLIAEGKTKSAVFTKT